MRSRGAPKAHPPMGVNRGRPKTSAGWTPRLGRAGVSGTRICVHCGACRAARGICMCAREKCICTRNQSQVLRGRRVRLAAQRPRVRQRASMIARVRAHGSEVLRRERALTGASRGAARMCGMRAWRSRCCAKLVLAVRCVCNRDVTCACAACCGRGEARAVLGMGQHVSRDQDCARGLRAGVLHGPRSPSGPVARGGC